MNGVIYLSTCIVTNKVYVGMTIQKFNKRKQDHIKVSFNPNSKAYNHHFHRAIRKYGKENFKWEILETIQEDTRKELIARLKQLEIEYIKKYDSKRNGYNSTDGGDCPAVECKRIKVFLDSGQLLETFDNVSELTNKYKLTKNTVWSVCGRFSYYARWQNQRLIFRYENDEITSEDWEKLSKINYDNSISVYCLSGELIKHFDNISIASKELDINRDRITVCASKKAAFTLIKGVRYIFRYGNETPTQEELEKAKSIKSDPKVKVIAIDSITNKIIGTFDSQSEAAQKLNTRKNNISEACSGKRKSAGKYNGHPIKWIKQSIL